MPEVKFTCPKKVILESGTAVCTYKGSGDPAWRQSDTAMVFWITPRPELVGTSPCNAETTGKQVDCFNDLLKQDPTADVPTPQSPTKSASASRKRTPRVSQ